MHSERSKTEGKVEHTVDLSFHVALAECGKPHRAISVLLESGLSPAHQIRVHSQPPVASLLGLGETAHLRFAVQAPVHRYRFQNR